MNGFDFGEIQLGNGYVGNTLEGNKIHEVTFTGCEARDFNGKDGSAKHVLEISFENEHGTFSHTIWEPTAEDFKDRTDPYLTPAVSKQIVVLLKMLVDAVNPEISKSFTAKCASWDELRKLAVDATKPGIGTKTKIKLLKKQDGTPIFPRYFLKYNKDNEMYVATYFIGKNLKFTKKEEEAIEKEAVAKPTAAPSNMFGDVAAPEPAQNSFSDLDFNL